MNKLQVQKANSGNASSAPTYSNSNTSYKNHNNNVKKDRKPRKVTLPMRHVAKRAIPREGFILQPVQQMANSLED